MLILKVPQKHCNVGEIESMVSDGISTISSTDYEKYRRNGPRIRMPYQLTEKNVHKPDPNHLEPERYIYIKYVFSDSYLCKFLYFISS